MRAFVLEKGGVENLAAVERPVPEPGPGDALLRITASALNYHDIPVLGGFLPWLRFPHVPLSDGCGFVEALGPAVDETTDLAVGDRVFTPFYPRWRAGPLSAETKRDVLGETRDGCLQEYVVVPAATCTKAPPHLDDAEVATLSCAGLTAWNAIVTLGRVRPGETVLLQGTGGVSLFALAFAKLAGATVIMTSASAQKRARAAELGAAHVIDREGDWAGAVKDLTGGRGADLVVDVGGASTLKLSVEASAHNGRVAVVGVLTGFEGADVNVLEISEKHLGMFGVSVGSAENARAMSTAVAAAKIRPVIASRHSFADCARALGELTEQKHFGKIALVAGAR